MASLSRELANEAATQAFAAQFAVALENPALIFLVGELGAGKTCFVRHTLYALGYEGKVKSPTYTIMEPYEIAGQHFYHFDLYRLADAEELELLGTRDVLGQSICFIEWPDKGAGWLPTADITVALQHEAEGRLLKVTAQSETGAAILRRMPSIAKTSHNDFGHDISS